MTSEARSPSGPGTPDPDAPNPRRGLSVGAVAARLGVAPDTVRSWGRRYGLVPSGRTAGGHRRFADHDLERLVEMQRLVAEGMAPAAAALQVLAGPGSAGPAVTGPAVTGPVVAGPARSDPPQAPRRGSTRGGPGGRVLAVPGGSRETRGLARAASRLDVEAMERILDRLLTERGAIGGWNEVIRPVLVAAGERWMASGDGIEIEHLLSESVMAACGRHRLRQPPAHPGRPVLLACSPDDMHVLPLYVLGAALAEHRVPTRQLGARVPISALVAASRRTGAAAVFVWRQIAGPGAETPLLLPTSRPPVRLIVGGPGWSAADLDPATVVAADLDEAVGILRAAAE